MVDLSCQEDIPPPKKAEVLAVLSQVVFLLLVASGEIAALAHIESLQPKLVNFCLPTSLERGVQGSS